MLRRVLIGCWLGGVLILSSARAAEPDPKGIEFFEKKIRPVLVDQCYKCHSASGDKLKGGLRLDNRQGLLTGGETGPSIIPGNPSDSLLMEALRHEGLEMPPDKKLPDQVIADFETWIRMGAPDPRDAEAAPTIRRTIDVEAGRNFWSFQPPKKVAPPKVKNAAWPKDEIDQFVLAAMEKQGLHPVGDADKLALLRRVYFDVIGLPPAPADIDAFLSDKSPKALEKVVDQLLESPRFGERWGRHWLDVARYAESNGNTDNTPFPYAWRYRDYVIDSFNADKPYDQFLREQLAGDLMTADNPQQRNEQLVATGFLALGSKPRSQNNPDFQMDIVAEQIEVTTSAMLGLTVLCARCHDHKFDPIPTSEYYSLAGIFTSSRPLYTNRNSRNNRNGGATGLVALEPIGAEDPDTAVAMGMSEANPADCEICIRGDSQNRGDRAPRGFITVATAGQISEINAKQSGRLELAQWIADAKNPLTARVMVNRLWYHLFSRGLVPTLDNFGELGERPTHPELLDHLALRFVDQGWSLKRMIRTLVLTRTYQLASSHDEANFARDPDNVWQWRMDPRRLDAEAFRDAMLAFSGRLDVTRPQPRADSAVNGNKRNAPALGVLGNYRSVYLPVIRNNLPEALGLFDFADPSIVVGQRQQTTVPAQSLYLMNSSFVVEQAQAAAQRLLAQEDLDDAGRVELAYRLAFARPPSSEQRERALTFLGRTADAYPGGKGRQESWAVLCQSLLAGAEFRYLD